MASHHGPNPAKALIIGPDEAGLEFAKVLGFSMEIVAFIDPDGGHADARINDIEVLGLESVSGISFDHIFITRSPADRYLQQLLEQGVDPARIEIVDPTTVALHAMPWEAVGRCLNGARIGLPGNCFDLSLLATVYKHYPVYQFMMQVKTLSMLHVDVLMLIWHLARYTTGTVLEVGPYIGGSTVALAAGITGRQGKVITVEKGGSCTHHPHMPSSDIIRDLRQNLQRFGVSSQVEIIEGVSQHQSVQGQVKDLLAGDKIGLMVMDADGQIEADLQCYKSMLAESCFIVIDDFVSLYANEKTELITESLNRMSERWGFRPLGVFGWGTLFGQLSQ